MAKRNMLQNKIPTGFLEQIIGSNCGKKTPLYDYDVILGRSKAAYISSQDPNVSRNHCSLKYGRNGWLIKDLGSVNGTYIDDVRIPANEYVPLESGCSIYFGPKEDAPEGYKFEKANPSHCDLHENELVKRNSRKDPLPQKPTESKSFKRKASPSDLPSQSSREKMTVIDVISVPGSAKTNLLVKFNSENYEEDGYHTDSSVSSLDSLKTRIRKANSSQKKKEKRARFCREHAPIAPSTSTGLFGSAIERLAFNTNSDSDNSQSLLNEDQLPDWNADVYKRSEAKNVSPVKKFICSSDLNSSSVAVHSNLLKVLQKKVNDLQKTLKTLNLKFSDTMNENARLVEVLKSKEEAEINVKEDFRKLLEDELICNICTELYIKPITLGCSHTFCQHCIFEWKKKKKQCPMCRERIEVETTCLFLDSFINKAVEKLDPSSLEKRMKLLKEREEAQKAKKPKRKKSKGNNRRQNINVPEVVEADREDEVEYLRSRISEIQSYTDDIQNYVDVIDELINDRIPDTAENSYNYLGSGLGRCYNCGRLGHWADDCPHH